MQRLSERIARVFRVILNRPKTASIPARTVAPHETWPELLHWQPGDIFDCCSSSVVEEPAPELIALTPDGYAYCWASCLHDNKVKIHVRHLVGRNETLISREIDSEIDTESGEYMELIRQFNLALKELQERDKRLSTNIRKAS